MPIRRITAWERRFVAAVMAMISARSRFAKPQSRAARAASEA
jgi:hypothetical protein